MEDFAHTFDSYMSFKLYDQPRSCEFCIRPADKKVICVSMDTINVCRFNRGQYCCDKECDEWTLSDMVCILHGRLHKYPTGYGLIIQETIDCIRENRVNDAFIRDEITESENFSFKEVLEIFDRLPTDRYQKSLEKKVKIIYGAALSRAALKHWLIKQVFEKHGISNLYPEQLVWD